MTIEKQREVIRLWNQLRKVEGPAAEELRIQILDCFAGQGSAGQGSAGQGSAEKDNAKRAA